MLRFCCIWIPNFVAWAAARHDPALRHHPVLIYGGGKVIAASPEVRAAGVQTGWSIGRAQALVPDVISLPQSVVPVSTIWDDLLAELYKLTPQIESIRPGMALLRVKPESVLKPLLEEWEAQGGAADDRSTAELAALTAPISKLRCVHPGRSRAFLKQVPMAALREVGVRDTVIERLGWFGWHKVGQLRAVTRRQLMAQFEAGEPLFRYAQASDLRPIASYLPPPCITVKFDFEEAAQEPYEIEPVLDLLVEEALTQLDGRICHSITVSLEAGADSQLQSAQQPLCQQRLLKEPTADPRLLREATYFGLHGLLRAGITVSAIEVRLGGLAQPQAVQRALFTASRPPVEAAIRAVEHRFPMMLRRIMTLDRHAYLPEEGFRLEPLCAAVDQMRANKPAPATRKRSVQKPLVSQPQHDRPQQGSSHSTKGFKEKASPAKDSGLPVLVLSL